ASLPKVSTRGGGSALGSPQAVGRDALEQKTPRHAQQPSGLGLIASGALQRLHDALPLQALDLSSKPAPRRLGPAFHLEPELGGGDHSTLRDHRCALDYVA